MIIDTLNMIDSIHHVHTPFEEHKNYAQKLVEAFIDISRCLEEKKGYLAEIQAKESGKPIKYGEIEVGRCISQLNQAVIFLKQSTLDVSDRRKTKRIPLGQVLAITTFSSPYSSFFHKVIPAIICDDTFIFLPSPKVYQCSEEIFFLTENCLRKYLPGIEEKIICVNTQQVDSDKVLERVDFKYLLFTGKSKTASYIKKKVGYCHGLFETGSCAIAYVDKDISNIDKLASKLVGAAFAQSGMRCIGLKNLFIQESISSILIEKIVENTKKVKCGDPLDYEIMVGPVFDSVMLIELEDTIAQLRKSGYKVLMGGFVQDNFLIPTVLLDICPEVYSIKEMYGPILCIHVVKDFTEISPIYYERSSLNIAFFSENIEQIQRFVNYCNTSGTICINCGPDRRDDELPFGGFFDENEGKEDLQTLIKELSREQRIMYE